MKDEPVEDEIGQSRDVALHREKFLTAILIVLDETAEAGADWINENQIREVEPGFGVVFQCNTL